MQRELYFRLVSIAALGLMALSCVPAVRNQPVPTAPTSPTSQVEIDAAQEVELINSGAYKPYVRPSETTTPQSVSPSSI